MHILVTALLVFALFADGFESATPAPQPVLVAQSAWDGPETWQHLANVQDYLRPPVPTSSPYCLQIATRPRWDHPTRPAWDAAASAARCVFGLDEFDQRGFTTEWLDAFYAPLPDDVTLVCNAACGAFPQRQTPWTASDIPIYPERCNVVACTPQYDAAWLVPHELLLQVGRPIMIWIDAYLPQEWGTCVSWGCTQAYDLVKLQKAQRTLERYKGDPRVWGFDVFIGRKPNNTPNDSRAMPFFPQLRAYLEQELATIE